MAKHEMICEHCGALIDGFDWREYWSDRYSCTDGAHWVSNESRRWFWEQGGPIK